MKTIERRVYFCSADEERNAARAKAVAEWEAQNGTMASRDVAEFAVCFVAT